MRSKDNRVQVCAGALPERGAAGLLGELYRAIAVDDRW